MNRMESYPIDEIGSRRSSNNSKNDDHIFEEPTVKTTYQFNPLTATSSTSSLNVPKSSSNRTNDASSSSSSQRTIPPSTFPPGAPLFGRKGKARSISISMRSDFASFRLTRNSVFWSRFSNNNNQQLSSTLEGREQTSEQQQQPETSNFPTTQSRLNTNQSAPTSSSRSRSTLSNFATRFRKSFSDCLPIMYTNTKPSNHEAEQIANNKRLRSRSGVHNRFHNEENDNRNDEHNNTQDEANMQWIANTSTLIKNTNRHHNRGSDMGSSVEFPQSNASSFLSLISTAEVENSDYDKILAKLNDEESARLILSLSKRAKVLASSADRTFEPGESIQHELFVLPRAPVITVGEYLCRICRYQNIFHENGPGYNSVGIRVLVIASLYIDRLRKTGLCILSNSIHLYYLTAALLALKMIEDDHCSNDYMARLGGIDLDHMNNLEIAFLKLIDYRCHFSEEDLTKQYEICYPRIDFKLDLPTSVVIQLPPASKTPTLPEEGELSKNSSSKEDHVEPKTTNDECGLLLTLA